MIHVTSITFVTFIEFVTLSNNFYNIKNFNQWLKKKQNA